MGKGDTPRPVNRKKWDKAWNGYCYRNGCVHRNGRCIYCGKPVELTTYIRRQDESNEQA